MKKTGSVFLLLSILLTVIAPAAFATEAAVDNWDYINDWAYLLNEAQMWDLELRAADISQRYQCGIFVFTIKNMYDLNVGYLYDDGDAYVFNKALYEGFGLGHGGDGSCLILCLSMDGRDYWLEPYGYGKTAFNSYGIDRMLDGHVLPRLKANDYYGAFSAYLNVAEEYLRMARDGAPFSKETDPVAIRDAFRARMGVTLLLPALVAWIVCAIWKRQMKTAVLAKSADAYVPQGGFALTSQSDVFLYRTTTRVKVESSSSSSRSSSSSSGSSGRGGKF
ncbi:MAG: TPM domain-containing protein [Clostridiales bacterium]|nr:TPM domain-containing protein [Clostridiales bacterium]